jgi:glutamate-1-semialdehyde 2,1-aminomutase
MRAGLVTLSLIGRPGFYSSLGEKTEMLVTGMETAAAAAGIPFTTHRLGGMFGFFFSETSPIRLFSHVMSCNADRFRRFFHGMLDEGVYLAPSSFEAGFVSSAHSESDISQTIDAAGRVFAALGD